MYSMPFASISSRTRRTASSRPSAPTKRSRSVIAQPPSSCSSIRGGRNGLPGYARVGQVRSRRQRRFRAAGERAGVDGSHICRSATGYDRSHGRPCSSATSYIHWWSASSLRRGRRRVTAWSRRCSSTPRGAGWCRRSTAGSSDLLRAGLNDLVETGKVHDADAYVCVAHRNDLGLARRGARPTRPAPDRDALAVIAQSRVGDRVCGTATEADGWAVDDSGCEPFREIREQLTAILLPRP